MVCKNSLRRSCRVLMGKWPPFKELSMTLSQFLFDLPAREDAQLSLHRHTGSCRAKEIDKNHWYSISRGPFVLSYVPLCSIGPILVIKVPKSIENMPFYSSLSNLFPIEVVPLSSFFMHNSWYFDVVSSCSLNFRHPYVGLLLSSFLLLMSLSVASPEKTILF